MASKQRQQSNIVNRLSVADRAELLTKTGTREGEVILQRDIGLLYTWTDTQGADNSGTILNVGSGSWIATYAGAVRFEWFGALGNGVADDYVSVKNCLDAFSSSDYKGNRAIIDGSNARYKVNTKLDIPLGVNINNMILDMTALTNETGFTTRVGQRHQNITILYSSSFSGIGWLFTTIDNESSTSIQNQDSNRYTMRDITVIKETPTSGIAWDWFTDASGVAFKWMGETNSATVSGFWGALGNNITAKGVWLDGMLIDNDGTGWITSSTVSNITFDNPRRGLTIDCQSTPNVTNNNILIDSINMQGHKWTKSGETDVYTEWIINAERTWCSNFQNVQPQDFEGTHFLTDFIRFGAEANRNFLTSPYILSADAFLDAGNNNGYDTLVGKKFSNYALSSDARTLDFYLEGEFAPQFASTGMTYTYSNQQGYFTRVGNIVHFTLYLNIDTISGTPTTTITILDLPYTASSESNNFTPISVGHINNIDYPVGYTQMGGYIAPNSTTITMQYYGDNVASQNAQASNMASGSRLMYSGSYRV